MAQFSYVRVIQKDDIKDVIRCLRKGMRYSKM